MSRFKIRRNTKRELKKQGLPLLIHLLDYPLLDLERVDTAQLQAAEADDVKAVHHQPIEPSQILCATQQQVEHHIMQRVVSPLVRNSAQVLTTVAPTGNNSTQ